MLQIVSVFPHIQRENGIEAHGQGIILIWQGYDGKLSCSIGNQPGEPGTELPQGGGLYLCLPLFLTAKGLCHLREGLLAGGSHQGEI